MDHTAQPAGSSTGWGKCLSDRIFEKFYQVDSSHATEGNGLGLAIVKKIVELHGGTISVESKVGEGSSFKVKLSKNNKI